MSLWRVFNDICQWFIDINTATASLFSLLANFHACEGKLPETELGRVVGQFRRNWVIYSTTLNFWAFRICHSSVRSNIWLKEHRTRVSMHRVCFRCNRVITPKILMSRAQLLRFHTWVISVVLSCRFAETKHGRLLSYDWGSCREFFVAHNNAQLLVICLCLHHSWGWLRLFVESTAKEVWFGS